MLTRTQFKMEPGSTSAAPPPGMPGARLIPISAKSFQDQVGATWTTLLIWSFIPHAGGSQESKAAWENDSVIFHVVMLGFFFFLSSFFTHTHIHHHPGFKAKKNESN